MLDNDKLNYGFPDESPLAKDDPSPVLTQARIAKEQLELLVVTNDSGLSATVREVLQSFGIRSVHFRIDSAQIPLMLATRHFDGIILERNSQSGAAEELLKKIRQAPSNRMCPVLAVANDFAGLRAMSRCGAHFVARHPVSSAEMRAEVERALHHIVREHRRYFRYAVDLPAMVACGRGDFNPARLINVSEEGVALSFCKKLNVGDTIQLRFDLPSIEPYVVDARGEATWADSGGRTGAKLISMSNEARSRYSDWLEFLRSQLEYRWFLQERENTTERSR